MLGTIDCYHGFSRKAPLYTVVAEEMERRHMRETRLQAQ